MEINPVRLQKIMSAAGIGSRRYCEILIESGRVSVNGQIITELGSRALETDEIRVDGVLILNRPEFKAYVFNKPTGVISAMSDNTGKSCLGDFVADLPVRVFHVGRLDEATEGLIIMTNDGELANSLSHPSHEIPKTYLATVTGEVSPYTIKLLQDGIELDDGPIACDKAILKQIHNGESLVEVVLHSGRNRIVRRMLAAVGHPVTRLVRTRVGNLGLDGLKPGALRELGFDDIKALSKTANL
jgi:23S rRNA pseudouridine2605 synthase